MTETRLIIGRGLLGESLATAGIDPLPLNRIVWSEPDRAKIQLRDLGREVATNAPGRWSIAWCAGASVVGSAKEQLAFEAEALQSFLLGLENTDPDASKGALFLASSAGAVHAGNQGEVISEETDTAPTSEYGHGKLTQESIVTEFAARTGIPLLVGRISNLYGARQNVQKPQGFISHLCRSILLKKPFVLSVPADTTRDFLHAEDAAKRIDVWLSRPPPSGTAELKILAAGRSVNLAQVITTTAKVTGLRPRVVVARNAVSRLQPRHLRFASRTREDLDRGFPARTLERGIAESWQHTLACHAISAD